MNDDPIFKKMNRAELIHGMRVLCLACGGVIRPGEPYVRVPEPGGWLSWRHPHCYGKPTGLDLSSPLKGVGHAK